MKSSGFRVYVPRLGLETNDSTGKANSPTSANFDRTSRGRANALLVSIREEFDDELDKQDRIAIVVVVAPHPHWT